MRSMIKRLLGIEQPLGDVATGDWSPVPTGRSRDWSDYLEKQGRDDTPSQQLANQALEGLAATHGKVAAERVPPKKAAPAPAPQPQPRPVAARSAAPAPRAAQKVDPLRHHIAPTWTSARPTTKTSAELRAPAPATAKPAATEPKAAKPAVASAAKPAVAPAPAKTAPADALSQRRALVLGGPRKRAGATVRPQAPIPRPARGAKPPVKTLPVEARNQPERPSRPRRPSRKTDVTQAARQSNPRLSALRQRPAPASPPLRARKPSGRHVLSPPAQAAPLPQPVVVEHTTPVKAAPAMPQAEWVNALKAYGEHLTDEELMILRSQLK